MLYWGKLNSTGNDSSHQEIHGFDQMFRATSITDVSITEELAAYLRVPGRKVTVVTSHKRNRKQPPYQRLVEEFQGKKMKTFQASYGGHFLGSTYGVLEGITLDMKEQVVIFNTGQEHVVLVSEAGTVWEWKRSAKSNIPRRFSSLTNIHIVQVACGNYHSVVLTRDGQLFTWGQNSSGQLGLGKGEPSSLSPSAPEVSVWDPTGSDQLEETTASPCLSLELCLGGAGTAGQLGLGDTEDRHVPVCVKSLNLKKTVFISCGEDHTAVQTKGGLIFTFGSGHYGQLGHNSFRDEHQPRVVAEFWGSTVSQIACGRHHTLALVESSNTVYSFGCGEQGQLGNGQRTNQCVPLPVQLPQDYNHDQTVKKISAGGNLSVLFISKMNGVQASSNLSSCNGTAVLDDEIIAHWTSDCNSKAWKRNQREIKKMFSSASCINGSFLEKSDKHYKTSIENSGLDLSLARVAFEKLAKKDKVLLQVEKVVGKDLLPTLGSTAAGVEALRVYLILPELLRVLNKQGCGTQLTVALASTILQLKPESMDVLTRLWTKLPYNYYRTLVKMFHSVCAHFMSLMMTKVCDHWTEVIPVLKVLQKLYNINSQRVTQLTEDYFLIKELSDFFDMVNQNNLRDLVIMMRLAEEMIIHGDEKLEILFNFLESAILLTIYPFILDMKSKRTVFHFLQIEHAAHFQFGIQNTLCVNRETVLADTIVYLKTSRHKFSLPLKVRFSLENGIDDGGVRAEFFSLLGQEITKRSVYSKHLKTRDSSGSLLIEEEMFYIGVMCGLAFYNRCFMNIGFPVALFKKLLNLSPTFSDLEELLPVEARCLKSLLMEDEDIVEELYLDFTVKGRELIPNGAEIPVTTANRQKYVDLYIDFVFNKSVENQFREFKEGFSHGNPFDFWKVFKHEELRNLLYGTSKYEWEELRKGVTYENCGTSDELIQNFWTVFFELNEEHQKKFLTFVYATDRLPVGGLSKQKLKIVRCNYEDADDRFPSAQTCYGILHLPNYSSIQILRSKLNHAITYCEVFGKA